MRAKKQTLVCFFLILIQISKGHTEKDFVTKAERLNMDIISSLTFSCHAF